MEGVLIDIDLRVGYAKESKIRNPKKCIHRIDKAILKAQGSKTKREQPLKSIRDGAN